MWGPHPPLRATCPPCGARKMLRAYADPCIFRPLQILRVPFFRRRQRELAIHRARGRLPYPPVCALGTSPGGGSKGCRGRQPLQEHGAAGRPLRHPAGRDTPGDTSPCAGEVIRAAEGVGPYGIWEGGARSPSQSTGGRTRRLTAPPEGEPSGVRSILARGPLRGAGGPFGLHNLYISLHILVYVIL